jgi:DMSO reductase anchor subunit
MIQTLIKIVLPIFILCISSIATDAILAIQLLVGWAFCICIPYIYSITSVPTLSKKLTKYIFSKYTACIQLAHMLLFTIFKVVFSLGLRLPIYSFNPFADQKAYFNNYYQS